MARMHITGARLTHILGVVTFIIFAVLSVKTSASAFFATFAAVLMAALLIIPARLLQWSRFASWRAALLELSYQGKWLGLWAAFWFWVAAVASVVDVGFDYTASNVLMAANLGILATLAAISNKYSYAHIKYWKHLNMLIWLVIPFTFVWVWSPQNIGWWPLQLFETSLLVACATAAITGLFESKPGYFARHRLVLLVIGAFVAFAVVAILPL